MGRTAENGAGAVVHQHEIGHIDRQSLAVDQGLQGLQAGGEALLLGGFQRRFAGAHAVAFGDEVGQVGIVRGQFGGQRMIGGDGAERRAEQGVGPRRIDFQRGRSRPPGRKTDAGLPSGRSSFPASGAPARASGQSSRPVSRSSAKSVIFRNHWFSRRFSTRAPERQPRPSMTCSLASTVCSSGSQLTQDSLR